MAVIPSAPATGLTKSKLQLATAESANVLAGKKFYSKDKTLKTGTMVNRTAATTVKLDSGFPVCTNVTPYFTACTDGIYRISYMPWKQPGYYDTDTALGVPATSFGNAKPWQVRSGVTFTSAAGLLAVGTRTTPDEKLLWKNSNTSAAFGAQTITISGLSNYVYVIVTFTNGNQIRVYQRNNSAIADCGAAANEGHVRYVSLSGNNITFGRCFYFNNNGNPGWAGYNDSQCVPYSVFALVN